MRNITSPALVLILALGGGLTRAAALPAQEAPGNRAKYVKRPVDPVLEDLRKRAAREAAERDRVTREIRQRQAERRKKERARRRVLRVDLTGLARPASPAACHAAFHFPPVAQYRTGTCWCFAGTSFLESEVARLTGRHIKLSEMHTVYYEYLEKARRYLRERGASVLGQGSECNAVLRMCKKYGAVPQAVYAGTRAKDGRHDHTRLFEELRSYLRFVSANHDWDEARHLAAVRIILNRHLGKPPASFEYEGRRLTPREFVRDVLALDLDAYVVAMSTLSVPFYTKGEFRVPDNWWHAADYHNLPLDDYYRVIKQAIAAGYTVALGGDTSEPGYDGSEDVAIVPDFDIPQAYINQDARELRFYNRTTTDDHAVHLVGHATVRGQDWFLIKDSARSSRRGKFKGYYFYRHDYIKLKMLALLVHRDILKDLLPRFRQRA